MESIRTKYKDIWFRSKLEASWARWFDENEITWVYEPEGYKFSDGTCYLPDFWLPRRRTFVEVKGIMREGDANKIARMTKECDKRGLRFVVVTSEIGVGLEPEPPPPQPGQAPKPEIPPVEAALLRLLIESPEATVAELKAREAFRALSHPGVAMFAEAQAKAVDLGQPFSLQDALGVVRDAGASKATLAALKIALTRRFPEPDDIGQSVLHLMRVYVTRRLKEVSVARGASNDTEGARLDAEALALIQLRATMSQNVPGESRP